MENFTPFSATIGGALIGLSAALLWLGTGRIAGISGILGTLLAPKPREIAWRVAFLLGLIGGPLMLAHATGHAPRIQIAATPMRVVVAGLLVGFCTRLGGGCTSGHGICGIARWSPRSLTATALFMLVAFATVFVTRSMSHGA